MRGLRKLAAAAGILAVGWLLSAVVWAAVQLVGRFAVFLAEVGG